MIASDHLALAAVAEEAAAERAVALCTIIGIDGSFSRRLGAQLAVRADGSTVGDLSDGCLEAALSKDALESMVDGRRRVMRYGKGSPIIDFRLPCGGGLDIVIDPLVDGAVAAQAMQRLSMRQAVTLALPMMPDGGAMELLDGGAHAATGHFSRQYIPALRVLAVGAGPEPEALCRLATTFGALCDRLAPIDGSGAGQLSLGRAPDTAAVDAWTAIILLFHDHEWEAGLLPWAVESPAFLVGAQGGAKARANREELLAGLGYDAAVIARVHGPVGLIARARDPNVLALSILAECVGQYERLMPG